jgi:hypothetical protein
LATAPDNTGIIKTIKPPAIQYMAGQSSSVAMPPAMLRDSRIPANSPPITIPTTRPRSAGRARWAAKGTMTWGTTLVKPTVKLATATTASSAPAR